MLRSIGAVVFGFVYIAALSIGADALVSVLLPGALARGSMMLLLTELYVGVFAVSGCDFTARLAPAKPMRHALVLGVLGLIFTIPGTVAMWNTMPAWYSVLGLALVMPFAWAGGWLRERQLARQARDGVAPSQGVMAQ
jgi:hypothetical protein